MIQSYYYTAGCIQSDDQSDDQTYTKSSHLRGYARGSTSWAAHRAMRGPENKKFWIPKPDFGRRTFEIFQILKYYGVMTCYVTLSQIFTS